MHDIDRSSPTGELLVQQFYERVWEKGEREALAQLCHPDFTFRGSLGDSLQGYGAFWEYLVRIRSAFDDYRCTMGVAVGNCDRLAVPVKFSGIHVGTLLGYGATGATVGWEAAAFFTFDMGRIVDLWVVGDTGQLERQLGAARCRGGGAEAH